MYVITVQTVFMQVIGIYGPYRNKTKAANYASYINDHTECVAKVMKVSKPKRIIKP